MDADRGQSLTVGLFGPVRAWLGDRELELGTPLRRAVLGLLATRSNKTVSRDELIDGVWGDEPPPSAVNALHGYVAGLRRVLEPCRAHRAPARILAASGRGYLLRLEPGRLDANVFCDHIAAARESRIAGDLPAAIRLLDAGLALWQEAPLLGIPGPWADTERVRLGELQLTALEDRTEVMLKAGRHAEAVAQLAVLVREHPLRERLRGQLMLALYRCGRRADALAVYADTRNTLIADLGIEPGPELQRLHARILATETSLGTASDPGSVVSGRMPSAGQPMVPAQLPGDVHAFTGREDELAELDRALAAAGIGIGGGPAAVAIFAVSGTPGVGKTALAVHWAHRVMHLFPDGQLYIDLRGYDPDQPPVPSELALAGFLRALGMAAPDVPAEFSERAAAYRSMLAGKRMLIVLDNACSAEHIRGLLPGSPCCLVVVTSRNRLAGIVAQHGARRLELDVLPPQEAVALLRALIGRRVAADPDAARTLAAQCARLPLALRVAAELAISSPGAALRDLAEELADEQRRLELLDAGGDPRTMVRSVFSWSYQHLPAAAARMFRLLGLHPGPDLDLHAAMALSGATEQQARSALNALSATYLIQGTRDGRYAMHDLLRAYAVSLTPDPAGGMDEPRAALTRLLDYYLATAAAAMGALAPAERNRRPAVSAAATPGQRPPVADPVTARAWLDAERAVLVAVTTFGARHGWPDHATQLAATLSRYLVTGGYNSDAIIIHEHALAAARGGGDRGAEATALVNLGEVRWRMGHPVHQNGHFEQALAILRETGDRVGEARAHGNLALLAWRRGRYAEAAGHYDQALAVFREIGDRVGEARALDNLGAICCRQGRHEQAAGQHEHALALFGEIGDRVGQARAFANLGWVRKKQGFLEQATDHLERSLELSVAIGDRACEAEALSDLGAVLLRQGRYRQATGKYHRAIVLFREISHQASEAEALNGSGEVLLATGQPGRARARHILALDLAVQVGDQYQQASAHDGLARSHVADGNRAAARHHWWHALDLFAQLDVPEVSAVRAHLATLDQNGTHNGVTLCKRLALAWIRVISAHSCTAWAYALFPWSYLRRAKLPNRQLTRVGRARGASLRWWWAGDIRARPIALRSASPNCRNRPLRPALRQELSEEIKKTISAIAASSVRLHDIKVLRRADALPVRGFHPPAHVLAHAMAGCRRVRLYGSHVQFRAGSAGRDRMDGGDSPADRE